MKSFENLIKEFDQTLRKFNPDEYKKLQPPPSKDEVEVNLKKIGIDDENFKSIYLWKNGEIEDSYSDVMKFGCFLSFDSIFETLNSAMYEYNPCLIPVISEGEQMLLFNTKKGNHYGKLYLYSVPQLYINYPISLYDSLASMLETTIAAYQLEIYRYDYERKMLLNDRTKFVELAKNKNPNSAYWFKHDVLREEEWYEI